MKVKPIEQHEQADVRMDGAFGVKMRMLIGGDDGAGNFHMRHFEIAAGGRTPYHRHDHEHEVLILSGTGLLHCEQGDQPFKANDIIFVPANEPHQFINNGEVSCTFLCLIPAPRECTL